MLIRTNPLQIINELNAILEGGMQRSRATDETRVESSSWVPSVDIKEEADKFILLVDLPGVDPKDAEISMENNILTIKGSRDEEITETNNYHRVERIKGKFYRRFNLPDTADADAITANVKLGVLCVTIGKKKAQQSRKISIETLK